MRRLWWIVGATVVCGVAVLGWMPEARGAVGATVVVPAGPGSVSVTRVTPAEAYAAPVPQPSIQELERLYELKLRRRGDVPDTGDGSGAPEASAGAAALPPETETPDAGESGMFPGNPALLLIGRNVVNANANNAALASTLAEPSAANNGSHVFAAGNFRHAEKTLNGAAPFVNVPLPGGPADAPILCCDNEVVIDDATRVLFHSTLYINAAASDGVIRIFVWRTISQATFNCSYDIRVNNGADTTVLPDFPHMGLTKRHLYLSINGVGSNTNIVRYMGRMQIQQLADCVPSPALQVFSQFAGSLDTQRAWFPGQGTNNHDAMYWGQMNPTCLRLPAACTSFQIFRWTDAGAAPVIFTRVIAGSPHNGSFDCRGGVGNANYFTGIATDARGFTLRTAVAPGALPDGRDAVGFWWNATRGAGILQVHVRSAIFDSVNLGLLAQPHIINQAVCFGYPNVSSNKRGDFGLHIAFGGRFGGGGTAAGTAIGVDDEFTPGLGIFNMLGVLAGTHNRADGRYGDYHAVRPHEPCEKWFTSTSYVLVNGTGVANVVSRYLEFGRNVSSRCWRNNAFQQPLG